MCAMIVRSDGWASAWVIPGDGPLLLLQAHFDESGHFRDPKTPIIAIAGPMASRESWDDFSREWKGVLDEFKLSTFHMKDFAHSEGEFKRDEWPESKRRAILKALLDIAERYVHQCVGAAIYCPGWHAHDERAKRLTVDPYYQCFQVVVQGLAGLTAFWDTGGVELARVGLVFAQRQETGAVRGGRAEQFYTRIIEWLNGPDYENHELLLGERLESVSFGRPERFYGLQLADIMAYELAHECHQQSMKNRVRPPRYPYKRISKMGAMFKLFTLGSDELSHLLR